MPAAEAFCWGLVPPHQLGSPAAAQGKGPRDSFPPAPAAEHLRQQRPPARRRAPAPTDRGTPGRAAAGGRACGNNARKPAHGAARSLLTDRWDPGAEPARTRDKNPEAGLCALLLSLWHLRHLPKLPGASRTHPVRRTPSATLAPATGSSNAEKRSLLPLAGRFLGGAEGEDGGIAERLGRERTLNTT